MRPALLLLALLPAAAASPLTDALRRPPGWFRSEAGRQAVENVLSWQSRHGSWPKNQDTFAQPRRGGRDKIQGTFDNGATTDELRLLARALAAGGDARCREAFLAGFDHVLAAQYPNGGWPQFHPPGKGYHRHITFNDNTMVRLLEFCREVARGDGYEFLDPARRRDADAAFERGIDCILKCQIVVRGRPTAWCAQHDEHDFRPRPARSYELPSLSGSESAGILRLLMSIENPSPAVARAIEAGAAWFESAKLTGIRVRKTDGDVRVIPDPAAPPVWARFYEIEGNQPFFCGRDGVKKRSLAEIEAERRSGYAWYGNWGEAVRKDHARWRSRLPSGSAGTGDAPRAGSAPRAP
jgi:pectate lyase